MRLRLPWCTLYAEPDGAPRWRVLGAMLAHEAVELCCGTAVAHRMRAAHRYAIGTSERPGLRASEFVINAAAITDDADLPEVIDGATLIVRKSNPSHDQNYLMRGDNDNDRWFPATPPLRVVDDFREFISALLTESHDPYTNGAPFAYAIGSSGFVELDD